MEKEQVINVMKRYELKYRLSKDQLDYFLSRISEHMKVDKYGLTSIVSINNDGSIKNTNNAHMFMLSKEECNDLALKVFNNELKGGKYNNYRFKKELKNDGLTYVGFIDIKDKLDSFYSFLLSSSLISIGAYAVMTGLIILGSKIVFKSSEEAYKNQKRFITNASHELKTPLTIISADMDIIEMDNGKSEWSESIRDQIKRLTDMTNQLVLLSKLEEDDPKRFEFNDFSINEVCNNAVNAFSNNFKKEGIKFSSNITGNLTMYGNRNMIDQLLYIFLAIYNPDARLFNCRVGSLYYL